MSDIPIHLWAAEYRAYTGTALSPFFHDKAGLINWFNSDLNRVQKIIKHVLLYTYNERNKSYDLFSTYPASILDSRCPDNLNKEQPCEGVNNLINRINEMERELSQLRVKILKGQ